MPKKPDHYYAWIIAYISTEHLDKVEKELKSHPEYAEVEAYIPTVKVLTKKFKGESTFDEVPLLFNYGFFKVPRKFATSSLYLDNLKENVSCIYGWVKDPAKKFKKYQQYENEKHTKTKVLDTHIYYATATSSEIAKLIKIAFDSDIHKGTELDNMREGQIITLRGYPFDGIQAELISLNAQKKQARVRIVMFDTKREVTVSFDNLFFTIYHNRSYDENMVDNKIILGDYEAFKNNK